MGQAYSFFAIFPSCCGGCVILFFVYRRFFPVQRDWHKAAEEATSAFGKLAGNTDRLARILPYLPFADIVSINRVKQLIQTEIAQEKKPGSLTDHMLLSMTQRTRLMVEYDNCTQSFIDGQKISTNSAPESKQEKQNQVHDSINKMRQIVKPNEVWLCSALEMAVSGRDYDVDALRGVYGQKVVPKDGTVSNAMLDEINIPQENTLHDHLVHGMVSLHSPRAVPPRGVATPRSPRSGGLTPRSPLYTPVGTPRTYADDAALYPNTPRSRTGGN
jgi:hypothetical protein